MPPVLLVLLCLINPAFAKTPIPVHFTATISPAPVHPGEIAVVRIDALVDPGWHIYSSVPNSEGKGPAATVISSAGSWNAEQPTDEDPPVRKYDSTLETEVGTHDAKATFERSFRVPATATPNSQLAVPITLHYQTCNDSVCLPATDVVVPATAAVEAGPVRPEYLHAKPVVIKSASASGKSPHGGSILWFLLAAIGAGLLAIITPCVFPLIPITLTSFVKQADGDKRKMARIATVYSAGIIALYLLIGGIVSATLGAAGANKIAANPWVNVAEFVVFLIFALSFFETITLQLPGNLAALQKTAREHGGSAGLMLMGVTFVLASFTCTAPFVGTLLFSAANGDRLMPVLGMFVFALSFVSPFLLAAAYPNWIGRIPKSGVWLARVKATLGFVELVAALKFLSNADQVWQWRLLTQPVLLAAWALILFCAFLYLIGTFRFGVVAETETDAQRRHIPLARKAWAGFFLAAGLYCFWGLTGRPISPFVGAFLPPPGYGGVGQSASEGLIPLTNYEAALEQGKTSGKFLLIDFTGYACTNCRFNEKNVFPKPGVRSRMAQFTYVQLYTDGGPDKNKNQNLEERLFDDVTLPLYGIVDPATGKVLDKIGGVVSVSAFTEFLNRNLSRPPTAAATTTAPQTNPTPADNGPMWAAYSAKAAADAARAGKPVVIDFTADWCINCKEIERDVFENPSVKPTLGRDFVTLRADLTKWSDPPSMALQKKYSFGELPTVILLDKTGKEARAARITGRLPVDDFLKRLALVTAR